MKLFDLKNKIKKKKFTLGTWLTIPSVLIPELYSKSELDWICVDMEHTSINLSDLENIIISSHNNNIPVLVRVGNHDQNTIKRIMDIGATGVIAANVRNASEVKNLVDALKYPPKGLRGLGLYRAQGYGDNLNNYYRWNNSQSILIIQIESKEGIENIEEITKNKNIDAVMVGPYDLSASLGVPGEFKSHKYQNALSTVLKQLKIKNIPAGIHVVSPNINEAKSLIKKGFRFISFSLDSLILKNTMNSSIKKIKNDFKI